MEITLTITVEPTASAEDEGLVEEDVRLELITSLKDDMDFEDFVITEVK